MTSTGIARPNEETGVEADPAPSGTEDLGNITTITVMVADDHGLVREGTARILESQPDLRIVAQASDGPETLRIVAQAQPNVLILDLHMPGMNGIDVARATADVAPGTKILVLTAFGDEEYLRAAMAAGASGFLSKTAPGDELIHAVRSIHAGSTVLDTSIASGKQSKSPLSGLTEREIEVVELLADGLSNKAIASKLQLSRRTIEGHLSRVFAKTNTASRTELLHLAYQARAARPGQ